VWFEQHQIDRGLDDKLIGDRFYDQLDGLVCISDTQKREVVEKHSIDPSRIAVAHDGVDCRAYEGLSTASARERLGIDLDERIVMYTGHLYPAKDIETLVRAAADFDGACYIVGGFEKDISRIKTDLEIPENVTFTGFVAPSEIPLYQTAADVLVATVAENPDQDYFSPLKIFEYMAAGKPMVVTRKPAYEEVLTDGRNALFVEAGSVSGLAERVGQLLGDPALRAALGENAREEVQQRDWNVRAERLLDEIRGEARETEPVRIAPSQ
jgi:glycosyltransferase involved in cell wall biosynthesis